jgi:hypothetical protein
MENDPDLNPPLTDEQAGIADLLVEECGLEDVADVELEMMGATGTVRYGLGRCATHLADMTPADVRDLVLLKLEQQRQPGS